jgi:hypothetical protein
MRGEPVARRRLTIDRKHNAMRWPTAKSEIQLPDALSEQVAFDGHGASLRGFSQRAHRSAHAAIPTLCLFGRSVMGPPVVSFFHILLGGASDDDASHSTASLNAVIGAELGIEFVEVLRVAGSPRVDPFLDCLTLLILPIQRVERLANNLRLRSALCGRRPPLNTFDNIIGQVNLHGLSPSISTVPRQVSNSQSFLSATPVF